MSTLISHERSIINEPVKVSSTFLSAFADVFNLLMVSAFTIYIVVSIYRLITGVFNVVSLLLLLFSVLFLFLYVWAILTRSLEVNDNGIVYQETFRKVVIKWDEIDSIHIEPWKKQITFWVRGKLTRIHTFGLDPGELAPLKDALLNYIRVHEIALK